MKYNDVLKINSNNCFDAIFIKWLDNESIEVESLSDKERYITHYKNVVSINGKPI